MKKDLALVLFISAIKIGTDVLERGITGSVVIKEGILAACLPWAPDLDLKIARLNSAEKTFSSLPEVAQMHILLLIEEKYRDWQNPAFPEYQSWIKIFRDLYLKEIGKDI